jgi:hypothetical protein
MTTEQDQELAAVHRIWRAANVAVEAGEPHPRSGVIALTIGAPPGAVLVLFIDIDGNRIAAVSEPRTDVPGPPAPESVQETLAI